MAKSSKRPSGDGLLRKRSDGRWEGRIVVGHKKDGSVIYKTEYAKTQKEVLQKLHQNIERYRDIDLSEDCRMTLAEWLDRWLNDYMANSARESTLEGYRRYMKTYVNPILGNKQINLITTLDVQKMYAKIRKQGRVKNHPEYGHRLKDSSVRKIHMMLHHAMDTAVQTGLIAKNPTEGTVVPKNNYPPKTVLDDEQLDRFMEEIKKDPIWYDFFYTEMTTGMRRGEICALQWDDFDEECGTIKVRRSFTTGRNGRNTVGDTKTFSGNRTIILPQSTVRVLAKRKKEALTKWIFHNPVFPEKAIAPEAAYRQMKKILASAELPNIRFHDLRHTFATHAISSGVDAKTLSGILGHTNASFTLDTYTHVTGDMHRKAAEVVGDLLGNIVGEELAEWGREEKTGTEHCTNAVTGNGKAGI